MFLTLDKNMNEGDALNPWDLSEEFKKTNLINNDDIKAFSFINPIKTRKSSNILSKNIYNSMKMEKVYLKN